MKVKKRGALSFALTLAVFMSLVFTPGAFRNGESYAHWADSYMNKLAGKSVMRGDEWGNFNPDRNVTRAEFAAMLNRAFGFQENKGASFSDVPQDAWYVDDISFASYQGYFQGSGDGYANPAASLTREEAVTMICRALKIEANPVDTLMFADSRSFSAWSKGYINAATEKGFLSGYGDNTFRPGNPITRGEVAKLLATAAGEIVNQPTQAYLGYVNGNVTLSKSGAGLRDTVITGDLYITEGVLEGYVFLENVTVLGSIIISGAGESNRAASSVVMTNCDVNNVIIDLNHNKKVSVIAQGDTVINNTVVKTLAYLEENNTRRSAFNDIQLKGPSGTRLDLSGEFTEVRIMAPGNEVRLNKGLIDRFVSDEVALGAKLFLERTTSVGELFVDGPIAVTGTGKIEFASIGANGANIAQVPDEIQIKPGYTAIVGGKTLGYLEAEMENESPRILNGYPKVEEITANAATGQSKGNKPGTIYWAVKEAGGGAPTETEMKEPKKGETFILQSGSVSLDMKKIEDDTELTSKISGLKQGGEYELYAMLVDAKGKASRVRSVDFETLDKTAPAFVSGYPREAADFIATPSAIHMLKYEVVPTKTSDIYWIIMPDKGPAPTAERLFAGNGMTGQIKHGGPIEARHDRVDVTSFIIRDLAEDTVYDVYIGLKDSKGNVSPVNKTTLRTKDVTPPEFLAPYPMAGTRTDKSIEIQYMTDTAATLYWSLLPRGTPFPPGAPESGAVNDKGGSISSYWETVEAQQAVRTGNNAFKSGNLKTTAEKPGAFSVSGLPADTAYDLYLLLEDASGNRGFVGRMEVMTISTVPPTARLVFDEFVTVAQADPPVGGNIMIAFSKPVKGVKNNEPAVELLNLSQDERLGDYIKLYKINSSGVELVDIAFNNVTVTENLGYTVVNFTTTGDNTPVGDPPYPPFAIEMESGGKYYFELSGIQDLGNLAMRPNTQTGSTRVPYNPSEPQPSFFTMKAPFVTLTNVPKPAAVLTAEWPYDVVFELDPKMQDASAELLFDLVFETSRNIKFELREIDPQGTATPVGDIKRSWTDLFMEAGKFYYIMEELTARGAEKAFNQLEKTRYGIILEELDGEKAGRWDGNLTFSVRGVSADFDGLKALAANSGRENISFADFMATIFARDIKEVSDPKKFERVVFFRDNSVPVFLSDTPDFVPGDSTIMMSVVLDKPATVFWLAAPTTSVDDPLLVTADQLIGGSYRPQGYKSGRFNVDSGNARVEEYIRGLQPMPAEYYVFYLARANTASDIKHEKVTMKPTQAPKFANTYPMGGSPGDQSATFLTLLDQDSSDAIVYWAAYPSGIWSESASGTPGWPTKERISQAGQSPDQNMADWGNFNLAASTRTPYSQIVRGLKIGAFYDVFVVARNPLGDMEGTSWTNVVRVDPITPRDPIPPQIVQPVVTSITWVGSTPQRHSGVVTVSFTKPLQYRNTAFGAWEGLKSIPIAASPSDPGMRCTVGTIGPLSYGIDAGSGNIQSITIPFSNVIHNSEITLSYRLGDGVNEAGRLSMVFIRSGTTEEEGYNSKWDVKLVPIPTGQ